MKSYYAESAENGVKSTKESMYMYEKCIKSEVLPEIKNHDFVFRVEKKFGDKKKLVFTIS